MPKGIKIKALHSLTSKIIEEHHKKDISHSNFESFGGQTNLPQKNGASRQSTSNG